MHIIVNSNIPPHAAWKTEDMALMPGWFNYIECSDQKPFGSRKEPESFRDVQAEYKVPGMPNALTRKDISRQERYLYTLNKVREFMKLPYGWHHGEGVPPSLKIVLRASELIKLALKNGLLTDAVPSLTGQIQIAVYGDEPKKKRYLEVTVGDDLLFNVTRYEMINSHWQITEESDFNTLKEVEAAVKRFAGDIYPWRFSYGYSLKDTITESSNGFQVKHSGITKEVSRLYRNYVSQTQVAPYATI